MKKILIVILFLHSIQAFTQTDGISYQAVIIGPNNQELPGVDAEGNILPEATIALRFTILDANNAIEYQEVQTTNTDQYGRINLLIGEVDPDGFAQISWDGTNKDLRVEIDFSGGSSFVDMSREKLTFLPYAYHRNISATGTLTVDDASFLNGELTVQGPTNLNSTLDVNNNNETNLSGELYVEGATSLNNNLKVVGVTTLNDSLNVNNQAPTNLSGDLTVDGTANLKDLATNSLVVETTSHLKGITNIDSTTTIKGQVTIKPVIDNLTTQDIYSKYPLLVEGSDQGIAIKVNGNRSSGNNFVSFWDDDKMWGRIEGQTISELNLDYQYERGRVKNVLDVVKAGTTATIAVLTAAFSTTEVAGAISSSTACVGFGACVTLPIPSLIANKLVKAILKFADVVVISYDLVSTIENAINYEVVAHTNIGVTYSSGSGDYAEWLPKLNLSETFIAGELVGIKNGLVTKNLWGVEKIMIVSTDPLLLGNMPQQNEEQNNVKIAFMGQVPVNVLGKVEPGDYILPHELVSGFGKAVHPKDMKTRDYKKVAGVAWSIIEEFTEDFNIVKVAVGININDLSEAVSQQEEELKSLKEVLNQLNTQVSESNMALAKLVPGYSEATGTLKTTGLSKGEKNIVDPDKTDKVYTDENDIIYFEVSREQIESAIEMAREQYLNMLSDESQINKLLLGKNEKSIDGVDNITLIPIKEHPFWQKIDANSAYKEELITFLQSNLEKAYHTHRKYAHNFTELNVKKD